jgi:hypothetical protein
VPLTPALATGQSGASARFGVYGGVIVPQAGARFWSAVHVLGENQQNLGTDHRLLVPGGGEASLYLLARLPGIEVVGGYTGLIDEPTTAEIRAELARGEILYALVPGAADPRANDPRLLAVERVCHVVQLYTTDENGPRLYLCNGPS